MKAATNHLTFETPNRREPIRITEGVVEWRDKVAPPSRPPPGDRPGSRRSSE